VAEVLQSTAVLLATLASPGRPEHPNGSTLSGAVSAPVSPAEGSTDERAFSLPARQAIHEARAEGSEAGAAASVAQKAAAAAEDAASLPGDPEDVAHAAIEAAQAKASEFSDVAKTAHNQLIRITHAADTVLGLPAAAGEDVVEAAHQELERALGMQTDAIREAASIIAEAERGEREYEAAAWAVSSPGDGSLAGSDTFDVWSPSTEGLRREPDPVAGAPDPPPQLAAAPERYCVPPPPVPPPRASSPAGNCISPTPGPCAPPRPLTSAWK